MPSRKPSLVDFRTDYSEEEEKVRIDAAKPWKRKHLKAESMQKRVSLQPKPIIEPLKSRIDMLYSTAAKSNGKIMPAPDDVDYGVRLKTEIKLF